MKSPQVVALLKEVDMMLNEMNIEKMKSIVEILLKIERGIGEMEDSMQDRIRTLIEERLEKSKQLLMPSIERYIASLKTNSPDEKKSSYYKKVLKDGQTKKQLLFDLEQAEMNSLDRALPTVPTHPIEVFDFPPVPTHEPECMIDSNDENDTLTSI